MRRKGLSQILWLIIAAAVLMMVALTLIFLAQGSLSGVGKDTAKQKCISVAQTQCEVSGSSSISTPSACLQSDGSLVPGLPPNYQRNTVSCNTG